ncbi:soyasaponin III rhamnosyltransferase-like [Lotus japonicus]|uniref:soyasaponin III rhamnosyltransferase-like n=1 Tax=Lotus japonicus TaxID=34305 RepID=UPI00258DAF72|nr:soyasaponin III rhamnosyltransferase-like [Lotus japonicus]
MAAPRTSHLSAIHHLLSAGRNQIQVKGKERNNLMDSTAPLPFSGNGEDKPLHIVMIPWLAMGHITPYFALAKVLAQKGHFITFINSPKNIDRMPKPPKSLEPFINLVRLPLPPIEHLPEGAESTMDIPTNKGYYLKLAYEGLQDAVAEILQTSKPDWVLYDFAADWLPPTAKSLNIPCAHYNITPAWSKCFFDPPKDQVKSYFNLEDMCSPPKWVPFHTTMSLRPYEIIRAFAAVKDESTGRSINYDPNKAYSSGDLFLLRSSRELEGEWLDYVADRYKMHVVPVGLLPPSLQIRDVEEEDKHPDWVKIKAWLDTQEPSSVVFIGFGSELKLSQQDLTELAHGIELSGLPFFWALKYLKDGSLELPEGFEDRTKDRGIVWKTWAPQPKILAHGVIGGCMSHSAAGSVIEMVNFGHVLVTLPYYLDQCLFSRALEEKKVGIEVPRNEQDGSFTRESVAKTLRLAIVDEEGSVYRKNAKEMGNVFSSKVLHDQYIEDCIAALQKYRLHSNR